MAKLLIKTQGLETQFLELKLGVNRIGRGPESDFQIEHPTVSSLHCEFVLAADSLILRDLESTNGTFVDGEAVREVPLTAGQTVHVGEVEMLVETTDIKIAIPKFVDRSLPAPPVVAQGGAMICPRHSLSTVSYRCTHCKEVMCETCVHRLRRKGSSRLLELCPLCSHAVELIGAPASKARKKSLFTRVSETVKLKLTGFINTTRHGS